MKRLIYSILSIVILFIILCGFLPTLLSSHWGTKMVLSYLNQDEVTSVHIGTLQLSWFGPQDIHELTYSQSKNGVSFHARQIESSTELWNLFFPKKNLKRVSLLAPYFQLISKNPTEAPPQFPSIEKTSFTPPPAVALLHANQLIAHLPTNFNIKGRFNVEEGKVKVDLPTQSSVELLDISGYVNMPKYALPQDLSIRCRTTQNSTSGQTTLEAKINDQQEISFLAKTLQFPVEGFDHLASLYNPKFKGLFIEGIGPTMDLTLEGTLSATQFNITCQVSSPKIIAQLDTQRTENSIVLTSPASVSMQLSPVFLQHIFQSIDLDPIQLENKVDLLVKIPELSIPVQGAHIDYQNTHLTATASLSPTELSHPNLPEKVSIQSLGAELKTDNLLNSFVLSGNIKIDSQNKTGTLDFSSTFDQFSLSSLDLETKRFPLSLFHENLPVLAFLGNELTMKTRSELSKKGTSLSIQASTPTLQVPSLKLLISDTISLTEATKWTLIPSKDLVKSPFFQLALGSPTTLEITKLSIPSWSTFERLNTHFTLSSPSVDVNTLSLANFNADVTITTLEKIAINVVSDTLKTQANLAMKPPFQSLAITSPISVDFALTPNQFAALFPDTLSHLELTQESHVFLKIRPFVYTYTQPLPPIQASATIDSAEVKNLKSNTPYTLKEIKADITADPQVERVDLSLKASAFQNKAKAGQIETTLHYAPHGMITGKASIQGLATDLIDSWLPANAPASALFGKTLDLSLESKESGDSRLFSLVIDSPRLKAKGAFKKGTTGIELTGRTASVKWNLTPDAFTLLRQWMNPGKTPLPFALEKPAQFDFTLSSFQMPDDIASTTVNASVNVKALHLLDQTHNTSYSFNNLSGTIEKKETSSPLTFGINGEASPSGKLNATGELHHLVDSSGTFSPSHLSAKIAFDVSDFPTPFFTFLSELLSGSQFDMRSVVGEKLNANGNAELEKFNGPFSLSLHSEVARASVSGHFTQGLLTLSEPLHAQLTVTKELSQVLLKKGNPLSISSLKAEHPLSLEISPQGVEIPLNPFEISKLNIPKIRLELGMIHTKPKGTLKNVLKLLKSTPSSSDDLSLWFTPMDMRIINGVLDVERTEVLVNNDFELALWGRINYPRDQVKMTLGLTEQALRTAFGITKLPKNYVLHIPLEGKPDDIHFDKVKATAKIAALLAWQHSSGKPSGGNLFGDVLGAIATLPDQDAHTPPPKKPFPWEQKRPKAKKTADRRRPYKNPLKEFIKVIR